MLLDDVLAPGLRVVFCGTALGAVSARVGAYYAGPGNRFWLTLHEVGLTPRVLEPREFRTVLRFGIGLTDVCKTRSGSDAEIGTDGFDVPRLRRAIEDAAPAWLAFTSKRAGRAVLGRSVEYGVQPERIGPTRCFVLPSPSGRARRWWDIEPWRELAGLLPPLSP
ncbi:MAG TPA: mismatch-specific DNA-glycosylase [Solirubrobacterales bacterium]|jgi:mismatch-specific thymine-DNA glycosylase